MAKEAQKARAHRANYSRDKKKGGWLVSVIGPNADKFAGREVPVNSANGDETFEKLGALIWSGPCTLPGFEGQNSALYTFEPKPREEVSYDF